MRGAKPLDFPLRAPNLGVMARLRKRLLAAVVVSMVSAGSPGIGVAQDAAQSARLDELLAELAQPDRPDWSNTEAEIVRLWSRSGSPAMDLLLSRANEAIAAEDYPVAVEHLSALIDHAPKFAEAWNARATAFYFMGEFSLSLADIEHTLALNPRHFGALEGLAAIFEELGEPELALRALQAARDINPNRPSVQDGLERLERKTGASDL